MDAGALLFPLESMRILDGSYELVTELTSAELADMGGGGVFHFEDGSSRETTFTYDQTGTYLESVSSSTTNRRPVRPTSAAIVARSRGATVRRSTTAADVPSALSFCAASRARWTLTPTPTMVTSPPPSAGLAVVVPILDDVGLGTTGSDSEAEPGESVIPEEMLPLGVCLRGFHSAKRQLWHCRSLPCVSAL